MMQKRPKVVPSLPPFQYEPLTPALAKAAVLVAAGMILVNWPQCSERRMRDNLSKPRPMRGSGR
jgi:hypothetical protein